MIAPGLRALMTIDIEVGAAVEIGPARRCIPILGGHFRGDAGEAALTGAVLAGADWQTILPDGALDIAAHYALRSDDGAVIEVSSTGVRAGPAETLARLARGEPVAPEDYYFRTSMRFVTTSLRHLRLNTVIAVSRGVRIPARVHLDVFELL